MEVDLAPDTIAAVYAFVRLTNEDVSGGCFPLLPVNSSSGLTLDHVYDFVVVVFVQSGSVAWFTNHDEE